MYRKSTCAVFCLRAIALTVFALLAPRAWNAELPSEFPAPTASEAPKWDPRNPPKMPSYRWPADFKLPLQIVIKDLPEVPKGLLGPSPPIKEEKRLPSFLGPSESGEDNATEAGEL